MKVLNSARFDVALIVTDEPCDGLLLLPFGRTKSLTAEFFNLEYTQSLRDPNSDLVRAEPSYHVGRAVRRTFVPDRLTGAMMSVMSMPWPAWAGSSGSPVIELNPKGWTIAGMVLENQESERLPAHLETIVAEDGEVSESVKYFVPHALVITERHLYEVMADEFGALFKGSR